MTSTERVWALITAERTRQQDKWGDQSGHEDEASPPEEPECPFAEQFEAQLIEHAVPLVEQKDPLMAMMVGLAKEIESARREQRKKSSREN